MHKAYDCTCVEDGDQPLEVPLGWEVAPCDDVSLQVCGEHAWQSEWLVLADGHIFGTGMCSNDSYIGECGACGAATTGGFGGTPKNVFGIHFF